MLIVSLSLFQSWYLGNWVNCGWKVIVMALLSWRKGNNVVKTLPEEKYIQLCRSISWSYIYINIQCNIFLYLYVPRRDRLDGRRMLVWTMRCDTKWFCPWPLTWALDFQVMQMSGWSRWTADQNQASTDCVPRMWPVSLEWMSAFTPVPWVSTLNPVQGLLPGTDIDLIPPSTPRMPLSAAGAAYNICK